MTWIIFSGLAIAAIVIFCWMGRIPKKDKPIPQGYRKCGCCDKLVDIHDPNLSRCHDCKTLWCRKCEQKPKAVCGCGNGNTQESIDYNNKNRVEMRRYYDRGMGMWVTYPVR